MNMQNGWKITKAEATAYSPFDNKNGIQASGNPRVTSRGLTPGPHVMAVDPKKIPYGSQLLLIYPDGTMIQGIAGDTGGALRQNKKVQVDVFKYTFEEAKAHGRKDVILLWK
jgi:3D (Asp-Asp-Asp) domain-containing protein